MKLRFLSGHNKYLLFDISFVMIGHMWECKRDLFHQNNIEYSIWIHVFVLPGRFSIPAISKLQELIETAWRQGFDAAGCEQLGGRLVSTRKWIGATEVVTFLASFKIRFESFYKNIILNDMLYIFLSQSLQTTSFAYHGHTFFHTLRISFPQVVDSFLL